MAVSKNRNRFTLHFLSFNLLSVLGIGVNAIYYREMSEAIPNLLPEAGINFSLLRSMCTSALLILFDLAWLRERLVWLVGIAALAWLSVFTFLDMSHFATRHAEIGAPQIVGLLRFVVIYLLIALMIDDRFRQAARTSSR